MDYPAYLRDTGLPERTYGVLNFNRRTKRWTIKGEPQVIEFAKRLFPGCDDDKKGSVSFYAHRRIIGDINWLMLRYPLEIKPSDASLWESSLDEARQYAVERRRFMSVSQTADPPGDVFPAKLMPFQTEGLAFLLSSRRCLLADEMGLGKTVQALAFIATVAAYPTLIIVPPHLVSNWKSETERFIKLDGGVRVHVIRGLTPYALPEADIYIIHYLLLRGWKQVLPEYRFEAVVFDEIQELRHAGTEKYSAASLVSEGKTNVIGLSGTPIYNAGGEIWNVINIIDYHFLGDWESFSREWCYGYGGDVVSKPELLGSYLKREGLMLRRLKKDVLGELPPKRRLVQQIDWNDKLYREFMRPVAEKLSLLDVADSSQARALLEDQICQTQRQATGIAKAPFVATFVRALVENGEKVLLFAHHHAVMDLYKTDLKSLHPGFITGRETDDKKDKAVSRFMEGKTDLLCISLRSASGLNLQRATCVVFGELDWSPAVHSQAEDRAHRIGHEDSLLCYYLVSPRGCDQTIQEALGLKVSQFVGLMGDERDSPEDEFLKQSSAREHIRALVQRLRDEPDI